MSDNLPREDLQSVECELLYALRAIEILSSAGLGIEYAIKHIATCDYGSLSMQFAQVLKEHESGVYLEDALANLARRTRSEGLRRTCEAMIATLRGDYGMSESFKEIAEQETAKKHLKIKDFTAKLSTFSRFFILAAVVTPIMTMMLMILTMITEWASLPMAGCSFPPATSFLILGIDLFIMLGIILATKNMEPGVG